MKIAILSSLFFFITNTFWSQSPGFDWGVLCGGVSDDRSNDLAIDQSGNILTTGYFNIQGDFDPGEDIFLLNAVGDQDIYIQKLSPEGEFMWAVSIGSDASLEYGAGIGVDSENNVYVTGSFLNPTDFDPGEGEFILNPGPFMDAFLLKLDADGNFIWVKQFGGALQSFGEKLYVDHNDHLLVGGYFSGSVDFNPGDEIEERTSAGQYDYYVVKIDPEGEFLWVATGGGTGYDYTYDVASDSVGNVFITGDFNTTANFDPENSDFSLTTNGNSDGFVAKYSAGGNFLWARQVGGTSAEQLRSIACDNQGNAIITGRFNLTVDFDPGDGVLEIEAFMGSADAFVWKLDENGDLDWVKTFESEGSTEGMALCVDQSNNIFTAGELMESADFDTGSGELILESAGQDDVYVVKLDESGNTDWAYVFGGSSNQWVTGIVVSNGNQVVTAGLNGGTIDFDQGTDEFLINGIGFGDVFIQSSQQPGSYVSNHNDFELSAYPIPTTDVLRIKSESKINSYRILDIQGKTVLDSSHSGYSLNLNVTFLPSGIYFISLETELGIVNTRWVKN